MKFLSPSSSTHNTTTHTLSVKEKSTENSFVAQHVFAETLAVTMITALAVHYTKKQMRAIKRKMLSQYFKNSFSSKSAGKGGKFLKPFLILCLIGAGFIALVPGSAALVLIVLILSLPFILILTGITTPNENNKPKEGSYFERKMHPKYDKYGNRLD